jgi:hypothetical protein
MHPVHAQPVVTARSSYPDLLLTIASLHAQDLFKQWLIVGLSSLQAT